MDAEKLKQLLKQDEEPKLEFKREYNFRGPVPDLEKGELTKDILALVNTEEHNAGDYAYLIIGAADKKKTDGTRELFDVAGRYNQDQLLEIINNKCGPHVTFSYSEVSVADKTLGVISIPFSPVLHELRKDIYDKNHTRWPESTVFCRVGTVIRPAKQADQEVLRDRKRQVKQRESVIAPLWVEVCELLRKEVVYVDHECARTSSKPLDALFVDRNFTHWDPTLGETSETHISQTSRDRKQWSDVRDQMEHGAVVILGDPGFGKTVSLLREVQERCRKALTTLEAQHTLSDDLAFGAYFHANRLASSLLEKKGQVFECIVQLLTERHQPVSDGLKAWLLRQVELGHVLLAVDALDEVLQSREIFLKDGLSALARSSAPCPLLFSARGVFYKTPPVSFSAEWELLPFTPKQLKQATLHWFRNDPKCLERFTKLINSTPPLGDLLTNPLLFMLACKVWKRAWEDAVTKGEPALTFRSRCDLYECSIKQFRERWIERMTEVEQEPTALAQATFLPFVQEVAWELWRRDPRRSTFTGQEISKAIEDVRKPPALSQRLDLLRDLCESGLLTKAGAEEADAPYLFLHRTLLEFLAASHVASEAEQSTARFQPAVAVKEYFGNPDAHVMLWMLAGKLKAPASFLKEMVTWAKDQLESPSEISADTDSPVISQLLVDCLFECHTYSLDINTRGASWEIVTRGLDRLQRREGEDEWRDVTDWSLVYRALRAAENHEGPLSRAEQVLKLLDDIRRAQFRLVKGGVLPADALSDAVPRLNSAYASPCPTVRWAAVWTTAALHARGRSEVAASFTKKLVEMLQHDDSPYVRSVAARALVQIQHPQAFELLKVALDGEFRMTAAGAANGLGRLVVRKEIDKRVRQQAYEVLKSKAHSLLTETLGISRDPLPIAVIGALEAVVGAARESTETELKRLLYDDELANIFMRAMHYPVPLINGTAASALGKMDWKTAWEPVKKLVELPDSGGTDTRRMRASGAFACDKLCSVIDEAEFPKAAEFLRQRLRDTKESPKVRRPAASGLEKLARRGYFSKLDAHDLLEGTQDQDPVVAKSCLLALTRFPQEAVLEDLMLLLQQFDRQRRKFVCEVVKNQPTKTGVTLVQWLVENDSRPDVIVEVLTAVGEASKKALNWRLPGLPDYMGDVELFRNISHRCLALSQHEKAEVICCSLFALQQLVQLPAFQKGEPLYPIRQELAAQAGVLQNHTERKVQESAKGTLEYSLKYERHRVQCDAPQHKGDRKVWTTFHPREGQRYFCDECRAEFAKEKQR